MSADNWRQCPRCFARREVHIREREAEVAALYGEIPVDEFDAARAELDAEKEERLPETFREDWEIGVYGGDDHDGSAPHFFASYKGGCRECGFGHTFKQTDSLDVGGAA